MYYHCSYYTSIDAGALSDMILTKAPRPDRDLILLVQPSVSTIVVHNNTSIDAGALSDMV